MRLSTILLVLTLACGCITKDVSQQPARYTDFVVGNVYQLSRETWIQHDAGDSPYLSVNNRSNAKMKIGTRLRVTRIMHRRSPTFGRITHVYAEVIDDSSDSNELVLTWVSKHDLQTGTTWMDTEVLEVVMDE